VRILTDYMLAVADYARAEAYRFVHVIKNSAIGLGILAAAGCFALTAVYLMFLCILFAFADLVGWTLGALITGGIMLGWAGIVAAVALWVMQKEE